MAAFLQRHDSGSEVALRAGAGSRSEADRGPRAAGGWSSGAREIFQEAIRQSSRSWPPRILTTRASATRSIAGSANASYTSACGWRSATPSRCRSRARRMPSSPRRRSSRWTARTGASARCSARSRRVGAGGALHAASSSATSRARRRGPRRPTTASFACRCAARGKRRRTGSRAGPRVRARAGALARRAQSAHLAQRRAGLGARARRSRLGESHVRQGRQDAVAAAAGRAVREVKRRRGAACLCDERASPRAG